MELYSIEEERTVRNFRLWLDEVNPDDFMPPESSGRIELAPEPRPRPPQLQTLAGELALCGSI